MNIPYVHDEVTHNFSAAAEVLPVLFEVYKPNSILDVGCGLGTWIGVAKTMGVDDIVGVDGAYVNRTLLKIKDTEFVECDLTKPFNLHRKFDLAICLEVAEHLPDSSADGLIQSLTNHADVIMFSAALPGQGGQNHINEQWPEYWQKIFEKYGFEMIDFFRPKVWNNNKVERWYRQNMFLVVRKGHALGSNVNKQVLALVHPELLSVLIQQHKDKVQELQSAIAKLKQRDVVGKVSKLLKRGKK